jgi:hypothetical protein
LPDYISDFPITTDGLALTEAFMLIEDPKLRRSIVKHVQEAAGNGD